MRTARRLARPWFLAATLTIAATQAPPAAARVEVTLDAETLTSFLASVTPPRILLPLPSGTEIELVLKDLKVNGFDPGAGKSGRGQVLTSLRLGVPALGLDLQVEPRLSIDIEEVQGERTCVLRFDKLPIPLPLTGPLDVSPLLPTVRVPANATWILPMRQGGVNVKSRLVDTRMAAESLRLGFDLDMAPERAVAKKER